MIFGKSCNEKIRTECRVFLQNLSCVASGTMAGTFFIFLFNILAGRFIGPAEYGKFSLINSIAMVAYVPMLFGISTAIIKFSSEKNDIERQKRIISTSYSLSILCSVVCITIYIIFSDFIANLISMPTSMYYYSILLSLIYAFNLVTMSTLNGLYEMKKFSLLKLLYGFLLFFFFIIFIMAKLTSFKSMIFSSYIAYGISGIIGLMIVRKYVGYYIDLSFAKTLLIYSLYTLLSGMSHILYTNMDTILINRYMPIENVGIYNAYYFSSINVMSMFIGIFTTVFFPTISKYEDKSIILSKTNKLIPYFIFLGVLLLIVPEYLILNIYGGNYPIDYVLMILFPITSVLISSYGIYGSIYNSAGHKGVKASFIGTFIIAVVNISLDIWFIPIVGISGAIGATLVAHIIGIGFLLMQKKALKV